MWIVDRLHKTIYTDKNTIKELKKLEVLKDRNTFYGYTLKTYPKAILTNSTNSLINNREQRRYKQRIQRRRYK